MRRRERERQREGETGEGEREIEREVGERNDLNEIDTAGEGSGTPNSGGLKIIALDEL